MGTQQVGLVSLVFLNAQELRTYTLCTFKWLKERESFFLLINSVVGAGEVGRDQIGITGAGPHLVFILLGKMSPVRCSSCSSTPPFLEDILLNGR